jgi:hypothetical protein
MADPLDTNGGVRIHLAGTIDRSRLSRLHGARAI